MSLAQIKEAPVDQWSLIVADHFGRASIEEIEEACDFMLKSLEEAISLEIAAEQLVSSAATLLPELDDGLAEAPESTTQTSAIQVLAELEDEDDAREPKKLLDGYGPTILATIGIFVGSIAALQFGSVYFGVATAFILWLMVGLVWNPLADKFKAAAFMGAGVATIPVGLLGSMEALPGTPFMLQIAPVVETTLMALASFVTYLIVRNRKS